MPEHTATIEYDGQKYRRRIISGRSYDPRPVAFLLGGMAVVRKNGSVWEVERWIMEPKPVIYARSVRFWTYARNFEEFDKHVH